MLLDELDAYYAKHSIAAVGFACPYRSDCSSGADDFVPAREPLVGDLYEQHVLPRLLFISLDPATDAVGRSAEARSMRAIREWETRQPRPANGGPNFKKQAHWYRTYELAHRLLSPIARDRGMSALSFSEMSLHFAHTNSAKCKDIGVGTAQGAKKLFQNCRRFIPGEVVALEPDIIVTQGKYAREAIDSAFAVRLIGATSDGRFSATVIEVGGRPVLKFETHHPNRKDRSYLDEVAGAWSWYANAARRFAAGGEVGLVEGCGFAGRTKTA